MGNGFGDFTQGNSTLETETQTPATPAVGSQPPVATIDNPTPVQNLTQPLNELQTPVEQAPAQPIEQPVEQPTMQSVEQPETVQQAPNESMTLTEPREVGQQGSMYGEKGAQQDEINSFEEPGPKGDKSGKGGTAVLIVLIVVIVALLATIGYFVYQLFLS